MASIVQFKTLGISGSHTGSLLGSASYGLSASFATNANFSISASAVTSASFAQTSILAASATSASYAVSASWAPGGGSSVSASYANSASAGGAFYAQSIQSEVTASAKTLASNKLFVGDDATNGSLNLFTAYIGTTGSVGALRLNGGANPVLDMNQTQNTTGTHFYMKRQGTTYAIFGIAGSNGDLHGSSAQNDFVLRANISNHLWLAAYDATTYVKIGAYAASSTFAVFGSEIYLYNRTTFTGNVASSGSYTTAINNAVGFFGTSSYAVSASYAPSLGGVAVADPILQSLYRARFN